MLSAWENLFIPKGHVRYFDLLSSTHCLADHYTEAKVQHVSTILSSASRFSFVQFCRLVLQSTTVLPVHGSPRYQASNDG